MPPSTPSSKSATDEAEPVRLTCPVCGAAPERDCNPLWDHDGRRPEPLRDEGGGRRECGEPATDGTGRVCRRVCAPGRDYHGGGHWYADPDLDGDYVRLATARWIVSGEQPERTSADRRA